VDNRPLAQIFSDIADLLEIKAENAFKIRAYRSAADTIGAWADPVARMDEKQLLELPGIGKDLAKKIRELADTGTCRFHQDLLLEFPPTILDLLRLQGVGPKTVALLYSALNISSVDDLVQAAQAGRLRELKGMGAKKEALILKAVQEREKDRGRHLLSDTTALAAELVAHLEGKAFALEFSGDYVAFVQVILYYFRYQFVGVVIRSPGFQADVGNQVHFFRNVVIAFIAVYVLVREKIAFNYFARKLHAFADQFITKFVFHTLAGFSGKQRGEFLDHLIAKLGQLFAIAVLQRIQLFTHVCEFVLPGLELLVQGAEVTLALIATGKSAGNVDGGNLVAGGNRRFVGCGGGRTGRRGQGCAAGLGNRHEGRK